MIPIDLDEEDDASYTVLKATGRHGVYVTIDSLELNTKVITIQIASTVVKFGHSSA